MFLSMGWSTIQMRHLIKNSQILKSGLYEALSVHDQGNAWHESYYHRKAHPRAALPNTSEDTNDQQAAREPRCYNLVDCRHQTALQGSVSSTCGIEFQPSFIPQQKQVKTFRKETCKALHAERKFSRFHKRPWPVRLKGKQIAALEDKKKTDWIW